MELKIIKTVGLLKEGSTINVASEENAKHLIGKGIAEDPKGKKAAPPKTEIVK